MPKLSVVVLAVVDLRPVETEVNETIELNVGSESRAGKGTENGDGSERLLEHLHFLIFWVCSGRTGRPASGDGSFPRGSVEMARTLLHCACTVVRSFLKTCEAFFQRTFRPCEIFTVALTRQTRRIARPSGAST